MIRLHTVTSVFHIKHRSESICQGCPHGSGNRAGYRGGDGGRGRKCNRGLIELFLGGFKTWPRRPPPTRFQRRIRLNWDCRARESLYRTVPFL